MLRERLDLDSRFLLKTVEFGFAARNTRTVQICPHRLRDEEASLSRSTGIFDALTTDARNSLHNVGPFLLALLHADTTHHTKNHLGRLQTFFLPLDV